MSGLDASPKEMKRVLAAMNYREVAFCGSLSKTEQLENWEKEVFEFSAFLLNLPDGCSFYLIYQFVRRSIS